MAARANHQVWHVSSAVSLLHLPFAALNSDYRHRARLACSSGRSIEPGLWESVPLPLAPWAAFRRLRQPERAYLRGFRSVPRAAARLGFERPDLLLIDEPRMGALVSALRPRVTIYRPTDMYSALKADPTLVGVERRQIEGLPHLVVRIV
jgi:teichuronic acid biosynthesis glycosyltransferase TuaH